MSGLLRGLMVDLPVGLVNATLVQPLVWSVKAGEAATHVVVQERARRAEDRPKLPPAGWYPDYADPGLVRWWDGHAWTSITAASGLRPRYAPPSLPPAGWYRDRDEPALLQWWDGYEWTGVVRSAGESFEDAPDADDEKPDAAPTDIAAGFARLRADEGHEDCAQA
jgi:hypothetical protein